MNISLPAPKQDGEELGGLRGAHGESPALPPPQALHHHRIYRAVREREKKQVHALINFAKCMRERVGTMRGNKKNKIILWLLHLS